MHKLKVPQLKTQEYEAENSQYWIVYFITKSLHTKLSQQVMDSENNYKAVLGMTLYADNHTYQIRLAK
ncbi:hypothetical protein ABEB36_012760 [Hypothenemus hampei]|uniref:Uncharacterized protein n=1 Tax=Hypothenemus hampei TaxID=57062 RepID=A0ABD1ED27_HYPHA